MEQNNKIIVFENKSIRRAWHDEQWYFSIIDVIEVLTDSVSPSHYWSMLKKRESELVTICYKLKMVAQDGKNRSTDCANTEGVLRIIMAIPSAKAEPFKLWLAQTGKERLEEIDNPELGFERLKEIYRAKGYLEDWIERRLKSIDIRKELTDEWKNRGVSENRDFSILTATIAKGTFGLTPSEHSKVKGLEKENLRDHMTNIELLFSALGEEITRQKAIESDAQGFNENHEAATQGGIITGNLVKQAESQGVKVVSPENYLNQLKGGEQTLPEGKE